MTLSLAIQNLQSSASQLWNGTASAELTACFHGSVILSLVLTALYIEQVIYARRK